MYRLIIDTRQVLEPTSLARSLNILTASFSLPSFRAPLICVSTRHLPAYQISLTHCKSPPDVDHNIGVTPMLRFHERILVLKLLRSSVVRFRNPERLSELCLCLGDVQRLLREKTKLNHCRLKKTSRALNLKGYLTQGWF